MRVGRLRSPPGVWGGSFCVTQDARRGSCPSLEQARCQTAQMASELYCSVGMKKIARKNRSIRLLRWVFQRDNQLLTCQLDREGHQAAYTLSLVPHWDVAHAAAETFEAGISAFRRHAAIADQLRGQGWTLAAYTVGR